MTLLPGAVTASAQLSAGPGHLPENTPMHSCSSCGSPPLLGSSPLPAYYHALRPLLLAPTLTHLLTLSLTCLGLGVIIGPLPGGGKESRKKKGWVGGGGDCLENNCSLTPCSDSRGSALTRTAGIPSSINILFLRLPVKGYRGGVRRVF